VAIDLETGDFEVDKSEITPCDRLEARHLDAQIGLSVSALVMFVDLVDGFNHCIDKSRHLLTKTDIFVILTINCLSLIQCAVADNQVP
jgi:hypothetical protein